MTVRINTDMRYTTMRTSVCSGVPGAGSCAKLTATGTVLCSAGRWRSVLRCRNIYIIFIIWSYFRRKRKKWSYWIGSFFLNHLWRFLSSSLKFSAWLRICSDVPCLASFTRRLNMPVNTRIRPNGVCVPCGYEHSCLSHLCTQLISVPRSWSNGYPLRRNFDKCWLRSRFCFRFCVATKALCDCNLPLVACPIPYTIALCNISTCSFIPLSRFLRSGRTPPPSNPFPCPFPSVFCLRDTGILCTRL